MTQTDKHKYIVLELDTLTNDINVIDTFTDNKTALEYMALTISTTQEYENSAWIKKYFDDERTISVYKCNYIAPKQLIKRYFIKAF